MSDEIKWVDVGMNNIGCEHPTTRAVLFVNADGKVSIDAWMKPTLSAPAETDWTFEGTATSLDVAKEIVRIVIESHTEMLRKIRAVLT
jgi:hypothetical protein